MPQIRSRIVFCDCLDCRDTPAAAPNAATAAFVSAASEAAARQEPPPKCLLICGTGFLQSQTSASGASSSKPVQAAGAGDATSPTCLEACTLPHLNKATQDGSLSLLAVRQHQADADTPGHQAPLEDLAQVLGLHQHLSSSSQQQQQQQQQQPQPGPQTIQERFKGMQAVIASNMPAAADLAAAAGFTVVSSLLLDDSQVGEDDAATAAFSNAHHMEALSLGGRQGRAVGAVPAPASNLNLPEPAGVAAGILKELALDNPQAGVDMVVLHVDLAVAVPGGGGSSSSSGGRGSGGSVNDAAMGPVSAALPAHTAQPGQQQQQQQLQQQEKLQQGARQPELYQPACQALEWLDRVLRYLNNSRPFKETVLLAVVLTPGGQALPGGPWLQPGGVLLRPGAPVAMSILAQPAAPSAPETPHNQSIPAGVGSGAQQAATAPAAGSISSGAGVHELLPLDPGFPVLRPKQSFEQLGGNPVDVDLQRPLLCMRRLPGVVRTDGCMRLGLAESAAAGGVGAVLADRLLHEVAYKLGRAPKYAA